MVMAVERFDCYEGTSAKDKLSKDTHVQGVNFFARIPGPEKSPMFVECGSPGSFHERFS
jgi:hypothetical protein